MSIYFLLKKYFIFLILLLTTGVAEAVTRAENGLLNEIQHPKNGASEVNNNSVFDAYVLPDDEKHFKKGHLTLATKHKKQAGAISAAEMDGKDTHAYLKAMVSAALIHSPEIRGAQANEEATGWDTEEVKGKRYPQLKVGMNTPFDSFGGGTSYYNSSPGDSSGSVSVSTPIFDWGKIREDIKSAESGHDSAVQALKEEKELIAYNTITQILDLGRYGDSLMVARQYVARMRELVDMLSKIVDSDGGRGSELTQARARLLSALAIKSQLQHQYDAALIKLVRLLGFEPNVPSNLQWNGDLIPCEKALAALDRHPGLLRNESEAKSAYARAESIKASRLPQVNWVISKSTAKDSNGNQQAWYTGLNVDWELFNGGSAHAAQQSALAQASVAREKVQTTRLELEYQIRNMVEMRDSSIVRTADYVRLSQETDKVRKEFYEQWFHLGKRTLLDVLTAETDHFNNQISAINTRFDAYSSNAGVMYNSATLLKWLAVP